MSTTFVRGRVQIGAPLDRVDGPLKVTGAAPYPADTPVAGALHGIIVQSKVARGRIAAIDDAAARAVPGVVEVMTYRNAPRVAQLEFNFGTPMTEALAPLQSDEIRYDGQHIAVVIGETFEAAREGALLLKIEYESERAAVSIAEPAKIEYPEQWFGDDVQVRRGDAESAFAASEVQIDAEYRTPIEHHNPLEPSSTTALWEGDELTVHDATQYVFGTRACLAAAFGLDESRVRVISPFIGGGFGCKGFFWSHPLVAAMAARLVERPVKLTLTREQMFTSVGHRSLTRQRVRLGAQRDGTLRAVLHDALNVSSQVGTFLEAAAGATPYLFACSDVAVSHALARLDVPTPTAMRAPGEAPGTFALGCALDELAVACELDPLDVLRRNHAERHSDDLPYSSKHLLACYERGAERFGWERRPRAARAMRDGDELIGWGVATATYPAMRSPAQARVAIAPDGSVEIATASHDLGTGTYTILTQIAADALGIPPSSIRVRLGDTAFPRAPVSGGSMSAASAGSAVFAAAERARESAIALAIRRRRSPLFGAAADEIDVDDGMLRVRGDGARAMSYGDVVRLAETPLLETTGGAAPGDEQDRFAFHSFGAQFVEVRVDEELGRVRVSRCVGAFDAGRILNPKTARSQMIGGIVWGISMALFEETVRDERNGAFVNTNLADYHMPVNADIGEIEIVFVEEPDYAFNPLGARGIGEIGITGVAAAVANAVYHATGVRVRDLPITPDRFLAAVR